MKIAVALVLALILAAVAAVIPALLVAVATPFGFLQAYALVIAAQMIVGARTSA